MAHLMESAEMQRHEQYKAKGIAKRNEQTLRGGEELLLMG
jgi:hypothetical protein